MDLKAILSRIDERRQTLGLSPRALSMRATGSPDLIRNWQRKVDETDGEPNGNDAGGGAQMTSLTKVAEALSVPLAWLISGGSEPGEMAEDATPFDGKPEAAAPIAALYANSGRHPAATHTATEDIPALGILRGDTLICDLSRLPNSGELAIVSISTGTTESARSAIRRYVAPLLIDYANGMRTPTERADDPNITLRFPIIGIVRGAS